MRGAVLGASCDLISPEFRAWPGSFGPDLAARTPAVSPARSEIADTKQPSFFKTVLHI